MTVLKKRKKAGKPRLPKFADEKYTGPEPDWTDADRMSAQLYYTERNRTTYYYNYYFTPKEGKPWVIDWMKKNGYSKEQISAVRNVPDAYVEMSLCSYCRALTLGMPINHKGVSEYIKTLAGVSSKSLVDADVYVKNKLETVIERGLSLVKEKKEVEEQKNVLRPNIQQLLREKSVEMAEEIDEFVDNFDYSVSTLKKFDPLRILRKVEAKGNHAKYIKSFYQYEFDEFDQLLNPPKRMSDETKEDYEQLKEGYNHLKKAEIKAIHQMYQTILDACDMLIEEGKVNRTPRKKKPVSKEKLVAKVKYCIQDSATKSVSQKPIECLDASAIMVYNTKTRKLGIYYPAEYQTFTFKGTTLVGFDENKSTQKTMRKPAEQLSQFKKVAKRSLQKEFDSIKSVETKMNGRFNEQTLILRIF